MKPFSNGKAALILAAILIMGLVLLPAGCSGTQRLRVATTTSLYDTGLWDVLEPAFEEMYGVRLHVISTGTGIALERGRGGDVDVIVIHAKQVELDFIADGYGVERVPFAYNYFIIVGPEDDPAGLAGLSPEDAFLKLYENPGTGKFISRGDNSGTHNKEKQIWTAAGLDYETDVREAGNWYIEGGDGMGPTLFKASELVAYTLTDIGTYLAFKGDLNLEVAIDSGSILLNVYSAIACTAAKNPEMAANLVHFLTSPGIQQLIANFGVADFGEPLFHACAGNEPTS